MPEWRLDEIAWISIHAPRTGSDANDHVYLSKDGISIHAPRTGSDNARESFHPGGLKFQSTLPARGATLLPPYNARRRGISIHAPRTGSDVQNHSFPRRADHFNPRSPHGERRRVRRYDCGITTKFQSTLPARGATKRFSPRTRQHSHFNPRSPHGERRYVSIQNPVLQDFNPRSPHGERLCAGAASSSPGSFQSTLPARGATASPADYGAGSGDFNPRSPHGERRPSRVPRRPWQSHFNPRSPHGERQRDTLKQQLADAFQSTLPARGATAQSTAPRSKGDYFNPRSPHGERPQQQHGSPDCIPISIHAPRTGSDASQRWKVVSANMISIHAPRTGSDPSMWTKTATSERDFNPRSPHGERHDSASAFCSLWHFNPRSPHGERQVSFAQPNKREIISIHAPRTGSDSTTTSSRWKQRNFNPRSPHGERRPGGRAVSR